MTMHSESAWSFLDPKPLNLYDPKFDAHITYWNGVAMTRTYALLIYSTVWLYSRPNNSISMSAWNEYNRIYRSGGFGTREWDSIISKVYYQNFHNNLMGYMVKKDREFFTRLKNQYTAQQAFEWFYPSKELNLK